MQAYPIELRERVLAAVDAGKSTQQEVARTFRVSAVWIRRLLRQRREEGSIAPRGHGGGRQAAFSGRLLDELDAFVEAYPDATLERIGRQFSDQVPCSLVTIHNTLQRLGWRFKKSGYVRVSKTDRT